MTQPPKPHSMIVDFVTGKTVPDIGAEANRQMVEKLLIEEKGYAKTDIEVDADIHFEIKGERYHSQVDLVVNVDGQRTMAVKCVAGSIGSREREIVAAARLLDTAPLPISMVSDGVDAVVIDTATGKKIGEGLSAIPSIEEARQCAGAAKRIPLPEDKREREKLIFRTYDSENINVQRNLT